jgi:glycosyltransferase involved in cell wall biosynthesis
VIELAAEQRRRGHDVLLVAGSLAAGEESMTYAADERGVPVHALPALRRELSPRHDAAAIRELRAILRRWRPDVLHTHTAKAGATGRLAALLAGAARPPATVHTFHGHVLSGYFSSRRERVFRRLERWLARTTSTVVAVSEEVRDDLVRFGVAPPGRIAIVPYGFDLDGLGDEGRRAELRAGLGAGDGTFVVGWAGRLTPIKRPLDLVRVLHELRARGVDAVLAAVGDGEDRAAVESLAVELGVADRCRLVGFRRDIADWYGAFDAFLLTSQNEGTPVAAIEALAAGRPVVATDAGGTRTVVTHGESGFLAPIGATSELAGRLAELAGDRALAARLGAHGAADVRARFSLGRMADEIDGVYRRALGG